MMASLGIHLQVVDHLNSFYHGIFLYPKEEIIYNNCSMRNELLTYTSLIIQINNLYLRLTRVWILINIIILKHVHVHAYNGFQFT